MQVSASTGLSKTMAVKIFLSYDTLLHFFHNLMWEIATSTTQRCCLNEDYYLHTTTTIS